MDFLPLTHLIFENLKKRQSVNLLNNEFDSIMSDVKLNLRKYIILKTEFETDLIKLLEVKPSSLSESEIYHFLVEKTEQIFEKEKIIPEPELMQIKKKNN